MKDKKGITFGALICVKVFIKTYKENRGNNCYLNYIKTNDFIILGYML